MATKIYITGARGRLGRIVLGEIKAIPIVRKETGLENEIVSDFSLENLKQILSDADVVIHLAGSRDFLDKKKSWEGNVELTRRIVEAMPKTAKIIFSSSVSVYGKKLAEIPANEGTPVNPDTAYAKTKLEAEKIVSVHPNHVILRIGPVYGPGFAEYFKVLHMISKGKMAVIGKGNNHIPFVHVADVARAIKNAIEKGCGIYVLVGECLSQNDIYAIAAGKMKVKPPQKHMPVLLAKIFAHLELRRTTHFGGKALFIPEDIAVLSSDRIFNCNKARRELGFSPRPLEEGLAEMIKKYKEYKS
ncbi:NAD-dependent epimerase/dehydratase family protein [Candidatus Micrarchaeota archaeon]|nr:NAD-dependent epimerase/dehydratase family protein [Candidatus Micrarchaeota archaeon]